MRKKMHSVQTGKTADVIFRRALEPMEACVLPAGERVRLGVLSMVPAADGILQWKKDQRAKIWVR